MVEADPGLISKYHMRPIPMVSILVPAYQHAAAVTMVSGQSVVSLGHLSGCTERYLAATKRFLDHADKNMPSNSPDELPHDPGR